MVSRLSNRHRQQKRVFAAAYAAMMTTGNDKIVSPKGGYFAGAGAAGLMSVDAEGHYIIAGAAAAAAVLAAIATDRSVGLDDKVLRENRQRD